MHLKNMSKPLVMKFHVAVAQATDMSKAEMPERMGALENPAEQK